MVVSRLRLASRRVVPPREARRSYGWCRPMSAHPYVAPLPCCPPRTPTPAFYRKSVRTLFDANKLLRCRCNSLNMRVFEGYPVFKENIGRPKRKILVLAYTFCFRNLSVPGLLDNFLLLGSYHRNLSQPPAVLSVARLRCYQRLLWKGGGVRWHAC
jgi:hypothetical protein